jgi:cytochrome c-type biogenesis protein
MDTDDGKALQSYGVIEIPVIVIIDRDGYVTYNEKGLQGYEELKEAAEAALSGEAAAIDLAQIGLLGMAFLAGLASFFSPCAFPLLPGYITYYFKQRADARVEGDAGDGARPTGRSAATGLKLGSFAGGGIVLVYGILGVVIIGLVLVGVGISDKAISYMKPTVGVILLVMGVLTLLDVPINTGYLTAPFSRLWERVRPSRGPRRPSTGPAGLFLYGVAYGSASASCSVPIFLALVGISVSTGNPMDALVTFAVFLLSMWLLMAVMTALLSVGEERVKRGLMRNYIAIKKVTGAVFVVAGAYLLWLFLKAEGLI